MSEGRSVRDWGLERVLAEATVDAYQVMQAPTGRAGVHDSATPIASGSYFTLTTAGQFTIAKTTGVVMLKGQRVYWDHSANTATYRKVNDRDFYLGRLAEDATSAATTCVVDLNVDPKYDIDLLRDGFLSVPVGTQAVGAFGYPKPLGGCYLMELTATNEAQKVDMLSVDGFAKGANAIVELIFRVPSDGAGTVVDVSLGIANATHATDADSITEAVFIHLDANNTNINAESDDGTVEVAATDTTTDYTEGSAVANRVHVLFDMRDPADVQIYVNGANVLPSTVFNVDAATGPFFLLAHMEKTSSTDTYQIVIDALRCWFAEQ